jgi:O-antigen/teichoic acid export membrane protein
MRLAKRGLRQVWYAPILAAAMGLIMLRMLILARVFSVEQFAQFSGGLLVSSTFSMLGCLGLQTMLQREWPVNLMRGQERRGVVRAAQCSLVALGCAVVCLTVVPVVRSAAGMPLAVLGIGVLHGLSQQLFVIATVESRSRGDALRYSRENMARALAVLAFGVAVAVLTGSAVATLACEATLGMMFSAAFFRRSLTRAAQHAATVYALAARGLGGVDWRAALTLMAIGGVGFLATNVDRWVAVNCLSAKEFGTYSFAWIVLLIAQAMQLVVNASAYPLIARRFAVGGHRAAFLACAVLSGAALAVGVIVVIPAGAVLSYAVPHWFPVYADAVTVLPIFLLVASLRVSDFWTSYLVITGRETQLLTLNCVVGFCGAASWGILVNWHLSRLHPRQVALLALTLTSLSYLSVACFAWRARTA